MIHLASPLPGASDAQGTIDVRVLPKFHRPPHDKPDLHHDPRAQAAKEGCLNIVRQAEKAGIKQIVFISSVAALTLLVPGVTIKAPLTSDGMSQCMARRPRPNTSLMFFILIFSDGRS